MWAAISGPCVQDGACVQSPNYPQYYSNSQQCTIEINAANAAPIVVEYFDTESYFDYLLVNGRKFSGRRRRPHGFTPSSSILWSSDSTVTRRGWRICEPDRRLLEEAPEPNVSALALAAASEPTEAEPEANLEASIEARRMVVGTLAVAAGVSLWALLVRHARQKGALPPLRGGLADGDAKGSGSSAAYVDVHGDTERGEGSRALVPL